MNRRDALRLDRALCRACGKWTRDFRFDEEARDNDESPFLCDPKCAQQDGYTLNGGDSTYTEVA